MACVTVLAAALSLSASPQSAALMHPRRIAADPSLSARFLPTRIVAEDAAQMASFRLLVSGLRSDSTRHWEIRHGRLEISYDMLQDLAAGNLPATGAGFGGRVAGYLSQRHGLKFRSPGAAYGIYLPNDHWYLDSPQWALRNTGTTIANRPGKAGVDIDIEKVWDKFSGNDSLVIAVVDAGFDFKHPDLKGRNWRNMAEVNGLPGVDDDNNGYVDDSVGWDFVDGDNFPMDYHGHGTYCSSVIAANFDNVEGIAGVVPQCRIMPVRVLDASGHGDEDQIAKGILYAVNNGAKVINFSIGGDGDNAALRNAFQVARDKGVPIVVAAGNDARDIDVSPAYPPSYTYDNMLVVAAHDHAGLLCGFSNVGKTSVDLAAPGELVLVAGIPDPKEVWRDDFEADLSKWTVSAGKFVLSTTGPLEGKQSLAWVSGSNDSAVTADYIDLAGRKGCVLRFQLQFHPSNAADALILEGNSEGSPLWREIGIIGGGVDSGAAISYGLQDFDGARFKLRFRTSQRISSSGRILKLDAVIVTAPDPNPPDEAIYNVVAGTSIAAPHVTAYVGLQRLACDRMGIPWTRALALEGVVPEASLAGKVATGGRLDAFKGLQFYLSTLPDFHVIDSTALTLFVGTQAKYLLELVPPPAQTYSFSVTGLGPGALIDGAGKLLWTPAAGDTGTHVVTLEANGPTLLRKRFTVTVQESSPVAITGIKRIADAQPYLRLGGQLFRLSPDFASGRHWVVISGIDALGKVQILKNGWMDAADFGSPMELKPASVSLARIQVSVDGQSLARGD
jgi:subtilisin family serine protease